MVELLLALNICVMIFVVVLFDPITATDWIKTVLPAWMQGLGTVAAAVVAVIAFRRWRQPDDARRQADSAQAIMTIARQLQETVLNARESNYTIGEPGMGERLTYYDRVREKLGDAGVADLRRQLNEFDSHKGEVIALFGEEGHQLMEALSHLCRGVLDARLGMRLDSEALHRMYEEDLTGLAKFIATVEFALGFRVISEQDWENEFGPGGISDSFRDLLVEAGLRFQQFLGGFLLARRG